MPGTSSKAQSCPELSSSLSCEEIAGCAELGTSALAEVSGGRDAEGCPVAPPCGLIGSGALGGSEGVSGAELETSTLAEVPGGRDAEG